MTHPQQLVTKRGIIHLYKIGILFQNRDFEHDVYELIKAFYPGNEIISLYEEDGADYDIRFRVSRDEEGYTISYDNGIDKQAAHVTKNVKQRKKKKLSKTQQQASEIEVSPSDIRANVMMYFINGGKINKSVLQQIFGSK